MPPMRDSPAGGGKKDISNQIPFIILLFADVICAGNVVINSIWALGFHCLLMLVAFRQRCKQLVLVCEFI